MKNDFQSGVPVTGVDVYVDVPLSSVTEILPSGVEVEAVIVMPPLKFLPSTSLIFGI